MLRFARVAVLDRSASDHRGARSAAVRSEDSGGAPRDRTKKRIEAEEDAGGEETLLPFLPLPGWIQTWGASRALTKIVDKIL